MTLAQILRKARFDKDLTIHEAARFIKIAPSHLHAIERGKKLRPKMETLYKLSVFYDINIDELCIAATRIPHDVFYGIIEHPYLLQLIRNWMR